MSKSIFKKASAHLGNGLPFVMYRKPGEQTVHLLIQETATLFPVEDFGQKGFVVAPFDAEKPSFLLKPHQHEKELFLDEGTSSSGKENIQARNPSQQNEYLSILTRTIAAIASGTCQKIVLSRNLEVPNAKDPITLFKDSLHLYPNAFCYVFSHPAVGIWLGATPETFLLARNGQMKTMALAGTLSDEAVQNEWGDKEYHEQQMVTDYILETLGGEVQHINTAAMETVKTGGLLHLRTNVTANYHPEKLPKIIKKLHPTPAVCGVPMEKAKEFVLQNEGYDREYYSGFLGELHMDGYTSAHLFVNLRCMKLIPGKAIIYVGGGITKDSNPLKEWEETVAKSGIMLKVLQGV